MIAIYANENSAELLIINNNYSVLFSHGLCYHFDDDDDNNNNYC